ncbi:MAG: hypothetical protein KDK99_14205 [Verrucomicrobiales bacterium]|nr:hypothetical protein [Verrucomicrobiales bacterium]
MPDSPAPAPPSTAPESPATPPAPRSSRFGRSGWLLLVLLFLIAAICLRYALDGPRPWGTEVTRRIEAGQELRVKEWAIIGLWWGCAVSAGIGALLLLTARLWMPGGSNAPRRPAPPPAAVKAVFYPVMGLLILMAAVERVPRLRQSLWNDEEYSMRRYAHGSWEEVKPERWEFEPVSWQDTLFKNANGNNHLLHSALSRLSLEGWRFFTGAERSEFKESALRMPSFIAGLFTLLAVALIGVELGGTWVGLGAAALLALHPWHLRYAVEARGYSLMLLGICVAVMALMHAIRRDKVLSWSIFALAQAAFLLSFAGSLHVAVLLNAAAAWELLRRREARRLRTLIGFNLLSAIPLLVWMLASVPQILEFLKREEILATPIGVQWMIDVGCHLAAGVLPSNPDAARHVGTSWVDQAVGMPGWEILLKYLLPSLALTGLFLSLRRPLAGRLGILAITLAAATAITQNYANGESMLSWYLLYLLIPLALAVPLALATLAPGGARTAGALIVLMVASYAIVTRPVRKIYITHDRQPIRQAVASYRDPHPEAISASLGVSDRQILSYDPRAQILQQPSDLPPLIQQARQQRRPLFIALCGHETTRQRDPELFTAVTESGNFELKKTLPGLEAMFSYEIWQLKPLPVSPP